MDEQARRRVGTGQKRKSQSQEIEEPTVEAETDETEGAAEVNEAIIELAPGAAIAKSRRVAYTQNKRLQSDHAVSSKTLKTYPARFKDEPYGDCLRFNAKKCEVICLSCGKSIGSRTNTILAHIGIGGGSSNTGSRHKSNYKRWKSNASIHDLIKAYIEVCARPRGQCVAQLLPASFTCSAHMCYTPSLMMKCLALRGARNIKSTDIPGQAAVGVEELTFRFRFAETFLVAGIPFLR